MILIKKFVIIVWIVGQKIVIDLIAIELEDVCVPELIVFVSVGWEHDRKKLSDGTI